jgi:hypothetical protein
MISDPNQFTNLAGKSEFASTVSRFRSQLADKLRTVRDSDLQQK